MQDPDQPGQGAGDLVSVAEFGRDVSRAPDGRDACVDIAQQCEGHAKGHERPTFDVLCTRRLSDRQRLFQERHRFGWAVDLRVTAAEPSQNPRAGSRGWLRWHQSDRLLKRGEIAGSVHDHRSVLAEPFVEESRSRRVDGRIHQSNRLADEGNRSRWRRAIGVERGAHEEIDPVERGACRRVRHLVPEIERALEVVPCLGGCVTRLCSDPCSDPCIERPRQVVSSLPVVGELRCPRCVAAAWPLAGKCPSERRVQSRPLAGQHVVVHGFANQSVAEQVALLTCSLVENKNVAREGLTERPFELSGIASGDFRQEPGRDTSSPSRRQADQVLRRIGQPGDAREQHLAKGVRQATPGRPCRQKLLGVEGVSLGAGEDLLDDLGLRLGAGDASQLVDELGAIEPLEVEAFRATGTLLLGKERGEWMSAAELVAPICRDEDDGGPPEIAPEESEKVQGRSVGPVDVLDHQPQPAPVGRADRA